MSAYLEDHAEGSVGELVDFGHFPEELFRLVERNVLKGLLVHFDHEKLLRRQLAEVKVLDGIHFHD